MTTEQKQQITDEVVRLAKLYGKIVKGVEQTSANKVAVKVGLSSATISHVIQGKWESIADEAWRKIKVKLKIDFDWETADTINLKYIKTKLDVAKNESISIGFAHDAGSGKSHTFKQYEKNNKNVFYIECKTYWTKKSYAKALVLACNLEDCENTIQNIEKFSDHIAGLYKPLVIIDQMDKLKDGSMDLFIDFYNDFQGHCGFILSGVPALDKIIKRGIKNEKSGFREIWSRVGRKFLPLKPLKLQDVKAICNANGFYHDEDIQVIFNSCEGDLRNVKKDVQLYLLIEKEKVA